MTKKEYMKPEIQDMGILEESELLAYSVKSTGLDDDLTLPDNEEPKSGDVWEEAW